MPKYQYHPLPSLPSFQRGYIHRVQPWADCFDVISFPCTVWDPFRDTKSEEDSPEFPQCLNAFTSLLHQSVKFCVQTLIPKSFKAWVERWQSYGLCTLAFGSLPSVFATNPSRGNPIISAKTSQISYFVYLSSEENCKICGKVDLSGLSMYLVAISTHSISNPLKTAETVITHPGKPSQHPPYW